MGGKRGLIDNGLPSVLFLVVFNIQKDLKGAIYAAMYVLFAGTGVILGAVYALKAYRMVMLGPQTRNDLDHLHDLNLREIIAMIVLTIFVFGIGFFPKSFFGKSDVTLDQYSNSILTKVGNP